MKPQILFVDDEPSILNGLRRSLRPMRNEWDMEFFSSSIEALARAKEKIFTVVVSDMKMPELNGAQLLNEIRNVTPGSIRIVLSGQANLDAVLSVAPVAHQYLSKPCNTDELKKIITRATKLRGMLQEKHIREHASCLNSLPIQISSYEKFSEELENEDVCKQKLIEIAMTDIALASKLLQLSSTEFFCNRKASVSIEQAIECIGTTCLKRLWFDHDCFIKFQGSKFVESCLSQVNKHSQEVSVLAEQIALSRTSDMPLIQRSKTAGLLHDAGKLLLLALETELYSTILDASQKNSTELREMEVKFFGESHPEVGAHLLGLWGLDKTIIEAVAYHHTPEINIDSNLSPATVVHMANAQSDC